MNIFNKIRDGLDPNKNGVNNFFRGVPQQAQKPINDAVNAIKTQLEAIGNDIENEITSGVATIYNEMKRRQGELVANVTRVGKDVEDGVKKVGGEIESAGKKVIGEVESKGGSVITEIEGVGKKVIDEIDGEVEKVIHKIQDEFKSGAAKKALKLLYAVASDEDNPVRATGGTISIIGYDIDDPASKIRTIKKYVDTPPTDYQTTIDMLKELDVAEITVTVSGEVFTSAISFSLYVKLDIVRAVAWLGKLDDHIKEAVKV